MYEPLFTKQISALKLRRGQQFRFADSESVYRFKFYSRLLHPGAGFKTVAIFTTSTDILAQLVSAGDIVFVEDIIPDKTLKALLCFHETDACDSIGPRDFAAIVWGDDPSKQGLFASDNGKWASIYAAGWLRGMHKRGLLVCNGGRKNRYYISDYGAEVIRRYVEDK